MSQAAVFPSHLMMIAAQRSPLAAVTPWSRPASVARGDGLAGRRDGLLPYETTDTGLTGGTRSLNRRLLALNLDGAQPRPEMRAGVGAVEVAVLPRSA